MHLDYQVLIQRWRGGVGSILLTKCPVGFDHNDNPLIHSPQISENTFPRYATSFSEMWKCIQYPKVMAWHCSGLWASPHCMQHLELKTLAFADQSNQWVNILISTVFLNWGKCPKIHQNGVQFNSQLAEEKVINSN